MNREILVLATKEEVAAESARRFVALAKAAIAARGYFVVALAGGSTPVAMYQLLRTGAWRDQVAWGQVYFFWGDERFVPPDDIDNTWRVAQETFFAYVPVPTANIFGVPTVGLTAAAGAAAYETTINAFFEQKGAEKPQFDLIFLGMGADGHTASLFPGYPAVSEPVAGLVLAVTESPKPPPTRITMTYPLINQARAVIFMVVGDDKATAVAAAVAAEGTAYDCPAWGVQLERGHLVWLLDGGAASALKDV